MQYVLAGVYLLHIASIAITWFFYPAGPIYDLETDQIIGEREGLTKWNAIMLVAFTFVNNWGYH